MSKGQKYFLLQIRLLFPDEIFFGVCVPILNGFYAFHPKLYYKSLIIG